MKRLIVPLVALAIAMTAIPSSAAPVTKRYVAGFISDTTPVLCAEEPGNETGQNIGAVCFGANPGDRIRITIEDLVVSPAGFFWGFMDEHWNYTFGQPAPAPVSELLTPCSYCGFTCAPLTITVPPGSVRLRIAPFGPVIGGLECAGEGSPGFGTVGDVTKIKL